MKMTLLLLMMFNYSVYSQNIKIENGMFFTIVENGVKQNKELKFEIEKETIEKIKTTDHYKATLMDTVFLNANKVKRNISSPMVAHLYSMVNGSIMTTSWKLKNKVSLDFIENSIGAIFINDNGEVIVKYYFKSKNDIGNDIFSVAEYNNETHEVDISN